MGNLLVALMNERSRMPTKTYTSDVGFDLYTSEETIVEPRGISEVHCGIRVELPWGTFAFLMGRSSTSYRLGLIVITGVIDPGFNGELFAQVVNTTDKPVKIEVGQRICQLVIMDVTDASPREVIEVPEDFLDSVNKDFNRRRNINGFGSSGQ